jgi:hypothetical protein
MTDALADSRLARIERVEGVRATRGLLIATVAAVAMWVPLIALPVGLLLVV